MSRLLVLPLLAALGLAAQPGLAASDDMEQLPRGGGQAFRAHMMDWSPANPAVTPPVRNPRTSPPDELLHLSSGFGWRRDPKNGARAMHNGIDMPGPLRSPVMAAAGGAVRYAGRAGGYGNMIEIDHGGGLVTRYAHLSRFLVASGARVERGETIATMGSTGRSTGSHLHFEVRLNGHATAPIDYLNGQSAAAGVSPRPTDPHISAFARARAEVEAGVDTGL